jgi:hypothetical protein
MSQQTNAGFNAPGFAVGADDPLGNIAAARAGSFVMTMSRNPICLRTPLAA